MAKGDRKKRARSMDVKTGESVDCCATMERIVNHGSPGAVAYASAAGDTNAKESDAVLSHSGIAGADTSESDLDHGDVGVGDPGVSQCDFNSISGDGGDSPSSLIDYSPDNIHYQDQFLAKRDTRGASSVIDVHDTAPAAVESTINARVHAREPDPDEGYAHELGSSLMTTPAFIVPPAGLAAHPPPVSLAARGALALSTATYYQSNTYTDSSSSDDMNDGLASAPESTQRLEAPKSAMAARRMTDPTEPSRRSPAYAPMPQPGRARGVDAETRSNDDLQPAAAPVSACDGRASDETELDGKSVHQTCQEKKKKKLDLGAVKPPRVIDSEEAIRSFLEDTRTHPYVGVRDEGVRLFQHYVDSINADHKVEINEYLAKNAKRYFKKSKRDQNPLKAFPKEESFFGVKTKHWVIQLSPNKKCAVRASVVVFDRVVFVCQIFLSLHDLKDRNYDAPTEATMRATILHNMSNPLVRDLAGHLRITDAATSAAAAPAAAKQAKRSG